LRREETDERVLEVAERMFAQLGYDGTTIEMIEDAVGPGSQRSELLRRGKQELYREVFTYLFKLSDDRMRTAAEKAPDDVEGVHYLVDEFFDFVLDHPEMPALWQQRGLLDAVDIDIPEDTYQPPLVTAMTFRRWHGVRPDLDVEFLAWIVMWSLGGFVHNGFPDESGLRRRAEDPAVLQRFREQLHELVGRML